MWLLNDKTFWRWNNKEKLINKEKKIMYCLSQYLVNEVTYLNRFPFVSFFPDALSKNRENTHQITFTGCFYCLFVCFHFPLFLLAISWYSFCFSYFCYYWNKIFKNYENIIVLRDYRFSFVYVFVIPSRNNIRLC